MYKSGRERSESAKPARAYPRLKRTLPDSARGLGPSLGRKIPPTAAEVPKKKMAREKVRETWVLFHPYPSIIGAWKKLQA